MGRFRFSGRHAVSTLVAILIAILLLSSLTGLLIYLVNEQQRSPQTGAGTIEEISEKIRENLETRLWRFEKPASDRYVLYINATNTGAVSLRVTGVVFIRRDGSVAFISVDPAVDMPMLAERTIRVEYSGETPVGAGLKTERGNIFAVQGIEMLTSTEEPFDFRVEVDPTSSSTQPGGTVTITVRVILVSGSPQTVSLSISGLPAGATASFSPESGLPTFTSTLTITTAPTTPTGTYTLTVTGTGGGISRSAIHTLTIGTGTATVTFSVSGMGPDASGTVLTVDGVNYAYSQLPVTFTWEVGSSHSFSWSSPVSAGSGKQYVWVSTSGLSTSQSGTITVPSGGGTVQATYKTRYKLTISVSPSGAGTTSPAPGEYWHDSGSSVSASATANAGYAFSHWLLDGSNAGSSNPISVTMDAPHTLTAVFAGSSSYTLTVYVYHSGTSTGIPGVTVKIDGSPYTTDSSGRVTVTVTSGDHTIEVVTPYYPSSDTRYVFTSWSDGSTANPRTVSVSSDTTLTAYMRREYKLTVNVNPPGGGSVSASPSSSDWFYQEGTSVTLTATPASGYAFDAWTGDASGTSRSTSVTMTSPKTVTANFFSFSISVSPTSGSVTAGGSVTATVTVTYQSGVNSKTISFSASGLPSGASASFSPSSVIISPSNPSATSTMTITTSSSTPTGTYSITITGSGGGLSKTATYTLTVSTATYTATVTFSVSGMGPDASGTVLTVDGVSYTYADLPKSFTWDVGSTHSFSWSSPVSAGTGKRYVWVSTSGLSTSRSGSITVPSGGGSVIATYKTEYYLTMGASPSDGGSVSPGSGWYDAGSLVTISATPASGWAFECWVGSGSGSYSGTSSSATITMSGPITEIAYFYTFSVSVSPTSGSCQQGGSVTATVTVTRIGGYIFPITVSLSASGLPSGATASFSPSIVTLSPGSTASSTMTISTSSSTPTGTYTITITASGGGLTKTTSYTLTVNPAIVTVTFYAQFRYKGGYQNAWGSATVLYVDGNTYTASQVGSGISFNWPVGSLHYVSWYSGLRYDESSYIADTDAQYDWSYSSGIFTSQSGYLTVPPGGGTVTAYYSRTILVYVSADPSYGGSVSPGSGWHPEGTSFTARANTGYEFRYWVVKSGNNPETTSASNPYYMWDPGYLTAKFSTYVTVTFRVRDSEGYPISGTYCYIYRASDNALIWLGTTNSEGIAGTTVEPGTYHVAVSQTTNNNGYSVSLLEFDGSSSYIKRNVPIYSSVTFTAEYETPLTTFVKNYVGVVWPQTMVVEGWIRSVHGNGVSGASIKATFCFSLLGWPGVAFTASKTTTSGEGGWFSASYQELLLVNFYYVDLEVISVPYGYRNYAGQVRWYPS